jgi:uncharacterized repeat protein (TIGR01451 family)
MKRRLAWGLACALLCAAAAPLPTRAEVVSTPLFVRPALTSGGQQIGTTRLRLNYEKGRFRWNGKTWSYRYMFDVDFIAGDNAWLTGFMPHSCGQPYALDPYAGGTDWGVTSWIDFNSRLPSYTISPRHMGLEGFTGTTYTAYSNAPPAPGRVTIAGEALVGIVWAQWLSEYDAITFGCEAGEIPGDPVLGLGIAGSKNPIGTGETLTATITLNNTGGYAGEGVKLTTDAVPGTDYVAGSTKKNGVKIEDKDGDTPLRKGVSVDVPAGGSVTYSYEMVVKPGGGTLNLGAHAALDGYDTLNASTQVQTIAPALGLTVGANKNKVTVGDTVEWHLTVKNSSPVDAKGVVVTHDEVPFLGHISDSTMVNGARVNDKNGVAALIQGVRVDIPANGTASIVCSMVVKPGVGDRTLEYVAHAALAGTPTVTARAQVQTYEIPTALQLFGKLGSAIEAANAAGAFRFAISGYPMFKRHHDQALAAYNKGDKQTTVYHLDRIATMAGWRGGYGMPELFKTGMVDHANTLQSTARALIAAL